MVWQKHDWRKASTVKHPAHLVIRWFHWSWRPRVYICYWEASMGQQRYKTLDFKEDNQWHTNRFPSK